MVHSRHSLVYFSHSNIIKYCNRPFANVTEHDEALIKNWNSVVQPEDDIYHLGDFAFASQGYIKNILRRLNGRKYLVYGNHDKKLRKFYKDEMAHVFEKVEDYIRLDVEDEEMDNDQTIIMCHYAFRVWDKAHFGSWNLFGHSHGTLPCSDTQAQYDVGVDNNNYTPVSYEEIKRIMTKKVFKPKDHHGKKEDSMLYIPSGGGR